MKSPTTLIILVLLAWQHDAVGFRLHNIDENRQDMSDLHSPLRNSLNRRQIRNDAVNRVQKSKL
jgi:hypothetical protein